MLAFELAAAPETYYAISDLLVGNDANDAPALGGGQYFDFQFGGNAGLGSAEGSITGFGGGGGMGISTENSLVGGDWNSDNNNNDNNNNNNADEEYRGERGEAEQKDGYFNQSLQQQQQQQQHPQGAEGWFASEQEEDPWVYGDEAAEAYQLASLDGGQGRQAEAGTRGNGGDGVGFDELSAGGLLGIADVELGTYFAEAQYRSEQRARDKALQRAREKRRKNKAAAAAAAVAAADNSSGFGGRVVGGGSIDTSLTSSVGRVKPLRLEQQQQQQQQQWGTEIPDDDLEEEEDFMRFD